MQTRQTRPDIADSAEAATKRLESQPNQGCMAEVIVQLDEMLLQVNPFVETYKRMHQIKYINR
jgi:hypothetical protein